MTSIDVEADPRASSAMPTTAAPTTPGVPFEVPVHSISHISATCSGWPPKGSTACIHRARTQYSAGAAEPHASRACRR